MREILFKAKRLDNGEWVEGDLLHTGDVDTVLISDCYSQLFRCDGNTVCQYTGLTDKNGKKIWENDIVCVTHEKYQDCDEMETYQLLPEIESYKRNYSVEFVNSGSRYGCRVRNKSIHFMLTRNVIFNHKVEVIGNIFDDKELLEVE
ncbi:MAG: YopX family protein [Faecalimonas sp.]|nr:YopX family protein [Faecalimonas sp.]